MPLTKKGKKIKSAMQDEYGADNGESVFYASKNKGTIRGVEKSGRSGKKQNAMGSSPRISKKGGY